MTKNKEIVRNILILLFAVMSAVSIYGQQEISGTIYEEVNGVKQPLPFANVFIPGTTRGATSDFDGKYTVTVYENDTLIKVSYMGYNDVLKSFHVSEGELIVDVVMSSSDAAMQLDAVTVTAKKNLANENMLLLEQKKAVVATESIGAVELSRKGVSNAEDALTKISGVTKQEGVKNVFVRGLGDRYNSTTLNGLPLPSDDPEYKNISLDIFSSDIIKNIGVNKTFTSSVYGDVGGANIDIVSKELQTDSELQIALGTGANLDNPNASSFLMIDGANIYGVVDQKKSPIVDFKKYGFVNSWNPTSANMILNNSISAMGGKQFEFNGKKLTAYLIGAYDSDYSYRQGVSRSVTAQGGTGKDLTFDRYAFSTSSLVMGNFKYEFGSQEQRKSIAYNTMLISSNSQKLSEYEGSREGFTEDEGLVYLNRRQQENNNNVIVNQLLADLQYGKINMNLGISYNMILGSEPDRRVNTFIKNEEDLNNVTIRLAKNGPKDNHRFYSALDERDLATRFLLSYQLGEKEGDNSRNYGEVQLGYNGRLTNRHFDAITFGHEINSQLNIEDWKDVDLILNQQGSDNGDFNLISNSVTRSNLEVPAYDDMYEVERNIHAGLLNLVYTFIPELTINAGLRFENAFQNVDWNTIGSSDNANDADGDDGKLEKNYVLPSLAVKYSLSSDNILRLGLSKSYTFPQFKEVALFRYEGADYNSVGNPDLKPSDNYNVDLKYEHYFRPGEIVSLTGFYKYIKNPINRSDVNSASDDLGYLNSGERATVAGVELEFRKKIISAETKYGMHKLQFGLNGSYIYSLQELTNPDASFKNKEGQLQGASPLLLNADLSYNTQGDDFKTTSTIAMNYFSDRVYSLGTQGRNDIIEKSATRLDLVCKIDYKDHWGFKVSAKNLLDPEYQLTQKIDSGDDIVVNSYKRGRKISFSLSYKF